MKKLTLLIASCFMITAFANAQTTTNDGKTINRCGTMEHLQWMKQQDPTLEARMQAEEKKFDDYIAAHQTELENNKTAYTIPVVVHLVYKSGGLGSNVTDAMVKEQIDQTNKDWAGTNGRSMGAFSSALRGNATITLCLATKDASGNATTGVTRTVTTVTSFSSDNKVKSSSTGGCNCWDYTKYLNIWVCDMQAFSGGLCGYSQFPTSGINSTYGSVIDFTCFGLSSTFGGTSTTATSPYDGGGTLSHELGHCLNLYHTWGDDGGGCTQTGVGNGSDGCADTPNSGNMNYGNIEDGSLAEQSTATSTLHTSSTPYYETDNCTTTSPGVLFQDFMDYSDDKDYACMTPNQDTRMQSAVATYLTSVAGNAATECSLSGINEIKLNNEITIYPNPTNSQFTVDFSTYLQPDVVINVYNIVGKLVQSVSSRDINKMDIDMSNQDSGVYFVAIKTSSGTITKKLSLIK
jgi:hypothetical protein